MKAGFQPQTSISKDRDNNLTGNHRLIMERLKKYIFYETFNSKDNVKIRKKVINQGTEEKTESPKKDEV
jgi:hypothetical protein